jgi:hypothetical protein
LIISFLRPVNHHNDTKQQLQIEPKKKTPVKERKPQMLSQNNYWKTKDKLLIRKKKKSIKCFLSPGILIKPSSCKIWDGTTRYGVIPSFFCSVSTLYQLDGIYII